MSGRAVVIRGDARHLPLPDASVDLIVTSPPFLNLRSYTDGGQHYDGQIGTGTLNQFLGDLWEATAEMARVLKPTGSIFMELGDSYTDKSLNDAPFRYAIGCRDKLGLLRRATIIYHRVNGLQESVTDRVRVSHSYVFYFTKQSRYYAAVDEIRLPQEFPNHGQIGKDARGAKLIGGIPNSQHRHNHRPAERALHPLGKLPGSVWDIPSQPLIVPEHLGIDHFACVDAETEVLTRRGWLRHDELQPGDDAAGLTWMLAQRDGRRATASTSTTMTGNWSRWTSHAGCRCGSRPTIGRSCIRSWAAITG